MAARVFLSYGHADAANLAVRLRTDLEAEGHSVWHDVHGIRVAHGWTGEIADALRKSDAVVALLSPHSVRRASDAGNADGRDSVCIDEIEYAVDAVRIPVVPAMAATCEPPFRIFRLQYVDFRTWEESDARYGDLLGQLLSALNTAVERGVSPARTGGSCRSPGISRRSSLNGAAVSLVGNGCSRRSRSGGETWPAARC